MQLIPARDIICMKGGDIVASGELKHRERMGITMNKKLAAELRQYSDENDSPIARVIERAVREYLDKKKDGQ